MLKLSPKILPLFFLCFLCGKVFSQDTTKMAIPAVWDLATCLEYAKSNNITLKNLRLDQKSAEQDKLLAKSALLPDLYGTGAISYNHYNSAGTSTVTSAGTTAVTTSSINNSGSLGLSSSWTLYQGGYLKTDIKQKDLSIQSANYNVLVSENDITLQITQAYLGILVDKESIIYNRDLVKTSTAQLAQAQRRFDAGSVAKKEVIQFQAQLATDQYNLTAAENAERTDKITLKQLLQLTEIQNFEVVKPDTLSPVGVIPDLSSVQKYALENRPEIKGAELAVKIADLDLSKAKSGYLPTLSMGASTGTSFTSGNTFSTFKQFDNNFYQQAGLTLSVPIFTKRANKTAVAKAKIAIYQSQNTLENAKTTLALTTERAYITVQNSKTQFTSADEQLKYNKELYRISNEELKIGTVNIYDFYQQRNLYVQALQTYIQTKYNAALAARIYEFYLGIPIKL